MILIGMPGAGKSTVGVLLAKTLGYGFLDTDLLIQQEEGALLQEILETRGAEGFLDAEEAVLRGLSCRRTVIAPGGSAVCREGAIEHLKKLGPAVYLRLSCAALRERLANIKTRGVVMAPGQTIEDLYEERDPLYRRYASCVVDEEGLTAEETVYEIIRALEAGRFSGRTID